MPVRHEMFSGYDYFCTRLSYDFIVSANGARHSRHRRNRCAGVKMPEPLDTPPTMPGTPTEEMIRYQRERYFGD